MENDINQLRAMVRGLLRAVDDLEGEQITYTNAQSLAVSADAVRVALGDPPKISANR